MTTLDPQKKTLTFQQQKFGLQDNEGTFVSLAEINPLRSNGNEKTFWQNLPWKESEIGTFDLGDLPCRLQIPSLAFALQKIWQLGTDESVVRLRWPHPRHDLFLQDLGYVRALLPETLGQLDPRYSQTGLATQLGVRFEVLEMALILDPHWQKALDEGNLTAKDIQLIAKQASNVIEWIEMQLQVKKSLWVQADPSYLDPAMKKQLEEQLQAQLNRGDTQAAQVIEQFLKNSAEAPSKAAKGKPS